jgi:hypothetical protein
MKDPSLLTRSTLIRVYGDDSFLREIIPPFEDRNKFTSLPWTGGYRWFRSSNVIPIEHFTRACTAGAPMLAPAPTSPPLPPKAA